MKRSICIVIISFYSFTTSQFILAIDPVKTIDVWPEMAPGESTLDPGTALPRRANEDPPATRIGGITRPQLLVFEPPASNRSGAAIVILPGGAYNYVVTDKEGSEAAAWLNSQGISAYVLKYRTKPKSNPDPELWRRPLQDTQRAIRLLRSQAKERKLDPGKIGIMGFSAGGQTAAIATTRFQQDAYDHVDEIDRLSSRPDFSLLIYPWNLVDPAGQLQDFLTIHQEIPPVFLVHAHDDRSSSLGSVYFYAELKKLGIPAELHVYESGGHGYGMRPVENSQVDTWPDRATDWLKQKHLTNSEN